MNENLGGIYDFNYKSTAQLRLAFFMEREMKIQILIALVCLILSPSILMADEINLRNDDDALVDSRRILAA